MHRLHRLNRLPGRRLLRLPYRHLSPERESAGGEGRKQEPLGDPHSRLLLKERTDRVDSTLFHG